MARFDGLDGRSRANRAGTATTKVAAMSARTLRTIRFRGRKTASCEHNGYHSATSRYDRQAGMLCFLLVCDSCGAEVQEVTHIAYRPHVGSYRSPPQAA